MALKRYVSDKFAGESTDTKPLDVEDGADFIQFDGVSSASNPGIDLFIKKDGAWVNLGITALWNMIGSLTPDTPDGLADQPLTISGLYTALEESTGTSHSDCIDDTTPTASVSGFYNGDSGTLTAYVDGVADGAIVLSTADDTGSQDSLNITDDYDPYLGIPGQQGFFKVLDANITSDTPLSYAYHFYQMLHSETGDSLVTYFHVDDPGVTTISGVSYSLPGASLGWVSGVPTLISGDSISVDFTVNNAVRKHYNATRLAVVSSSYTTSNTCAPPGTPPVEGASVAYTSRVVTVSNNVYSEDIDINIRGYNSKNVGGTINNGNTGARVDTVSDESARRISGSGEFPSSGYGGTFDSTISLRSTYTEELQMLNGRYQVPDGNYTGNLPTAGPDYTAGMGTGDRWVTFPLTTLDNDLAFTLTFTGYQGSWSGTETTGIKIYAKVEGSTGWVDCNAAYPGVGIPVSDGDPAMVFGSSSTYVKRVTLGTVRSGILYVRIGLPYTSNKRFSGVSISDIN